MKSTIGELSSRRSVLLHTRLWSRIKKCLSCFSNILYTVQESDRARRSVVGVYACAFWPYSVRSRPWPLTVWPENITGLSLFPNEPPKLEAYRLGEILPSGFMKYRVYSLTYAQTHGRTDAQPENTMPPPAVMDRGIKRIPDTDVMWSPLV